MVRFCGQSEPKIHLKIFAAGALRGYLLLFLAWVEGARNKWAKERTGEREGDATQAKLFHK